MKNTKVLTLVECAIMLGLAVALSMIKVFEMPMGGSVTLLSMLPIVLISIKYGVKIGLPVAFLFSAIKFATGFWVSVVPWIKEPYALVTSAALDYFIPFTLLGLAGLFRYKTTTGWCAGIALVIFARFLCHLVSGIVIWGQWAEDMTPFMYSLGYNAWYMLPELILTMTGAVVLLKAPHVRKIFTPVQT
ncbi:MAG: energy-coupled thiamine transporter ThiT [Oscillospiraceae bacterium]|nr:energy-coupled thiamine transporter ThiT [Oscillospiraceae bacterium]